MSAALATVGVMTQALEPEIVLTDTPDPCDPPGTTRVFLSKTL